MRRRDRSSRRHDSVASLSQLTFLLRAIVVVGSCAYVAVTVFGQIALFGSCPPRSCIPFVEPGFGHLALRVVLSVPVLLGLAAVAVRFVSLNHRFASWRHVVRWAGALVGLVDCSVLVGSFAPVASVPLVCLASIAWCWAVRSRARLPRRIGC